MMRNAMLAAAVVAASWLGAFGVALGVTEWRGGDAVQVSSQPTLCTRVTDAYYDAVGTAGITEERLQYLFDEAQIACRD